MRIADCGLFPDHADIVVLGHGLCGPSGPSRATYQPGSDEFEMPPALVTCLPQHAPEILMRNKSKLACEDVVDHVALFVAELSRANRGAGVFLIEARAPLLYEKEHLPHDRELRVV
ncbi:MAG: hypothetical protein AB7Q81_05710 [Gammaproteobacteria bacterium]